MVKQSWDRVVVGRESQAEIAERLRGGQCLQVASQSGEAALNSELSHARQAAAPAHLKLEQGERCCGRETAFGTSSARDRQTGDAFVIAEQGQQSVVFAQWAHLQDEALQASFAHLTGGPS